MRTKACVFNEESPKSQFSCTICPFSSNSQSELLFHEALHTEPILEEQGQSLRKKPIYQYKCPICEKLYPKASLRYHLRVHTSERPYACSVCGAGFVRKSHWNVHVQNHERKETRETEKEKMKVAQGDRPFLCCTCGASFKRK